MRGATCVHIRCRKPRPASPRHACARGFGTGTQTVLQSPLAAVSSAATAAANPASGDGVPATPASGVLATLASGGGVPVTPASGGGVPATSASGGGVPATPASGGGVPATSASGGGVPATPASGAGVPATLAFGGGGDPRPAPMSCACRAPVPAALLPATWLAGPCATPLAGLTPQSCGVAASSRDMSFFAAPVVRPAPRKSSSVSAYRRRYARGLEAVRERPSATSVASDDKRGWHGFGVHQGRASANHTLGAMKWSALLLMWVLGNGEHMGIQTRADRTLANAD